MICRTCLRRAATVLPPRSVLRLPTHRQFTNTIQERSAAAAQTADAIANATPEPAPPEGSTESTTGEALSTCPKGTVLAGLNYFKGRTDPVALADHEYPGWLWTCLEVQQKAGGDEDLAEGDEYSKSKKQRRVAAKRQRQLEAQILASGDLSALAPKIPLQEQTINLSGAEDGSIESTVLAAEKREELRQAMRKERKSKIKESNYLKSM